MNGPTHQFAGAIAVLAITQMDSEDKIARCYIIQQLRSPLVLSSASYTI